MGKGTMEGMRIICVCTGNKFTQWHVDNLKHMIDAYSGIQYSEFVCVSEDLYNGVYNKLLIFDKFRTGKNLFFDLDIVIHDKIPDLTAKKLSLVNCWWRDKWHTPLNSSIMSWTGDQSHIYNKFKNDKEHYLEKYHKGIDEFIYKEVSYDLLPDVCYSMQGQEYEIKNKKYPICLLNQRQVYMEPGWHGWWKDYFISEMT